MSFWHRGAARKSWRTGSKKRPGWNEIPAVHDDRIVEIKSALILQPGPAALTDGLDAIVAALWPADRVFSGCGAACTLHRVGDTITYSASTPHHSAMNSAVALVDFRSDSRSTYSLKPCIAAPLAPKHRLGML
jgi:hypothetical protein